MKRTLLLVALGLAMCSVAKADSACTTATLSTYLAAGFSCTLDGLTFSSFSASFNQSGGAANPGAAGITITPTLAGLVFDFTGGWVVSSGQTLDTIVRFTIDSASPIISDLSLTLVAAGCSGPGAVGLTENAASVGASLFTSCTNGSVDLTTHTATFSPVSSLTVVKDLTLSGGTTGSASVSEFTNAVSDVPEPGTLALFGTGLLGLASLIRRKLRRELP